MKTQLQAIEEKIKTLKHFKHGSELTADVILDDLDDAMMDDIVGFMEIKTHKKALQYLNKLKHKYNK